MFKKFAVFSYFYSFFEAIQQFLPKITGHCKYPIFLKFFLEMPSVNINERVICLEYGREHTRKDASRDRRTCGVLKCPNCNFSTYRSDELTNDFKKHCQHNVKL